MPRGARERAMATSGGRAAERGRAAEERVADGRRAAEDPADTGRVFPCVLALLPVALSARVRAVTLGVSYQRWCDSRDRVGCTAVVLLTMQAGCSGMPRLQDRPKPWHEATLITRTATSVGAREAPLMSRGWCCRTPACATPCRARGPTPAPDTRVARR
jgi:hypothetical protein